VAQPPLIGALGDALISFLDWAWPRVAPRFEDLFESVADAVRPDPPMSLHPLDGQIVTGVAVIDRGQVIAFVGTRQPASASHPWRPHRDDVLFDDGSPLWGRDHGQYGR
jgi:hypothetical protein